MAERFSDIRSPEKGPKEHSAEQLEKAKSVEHSAESSAKFDREKTLEAARDELKKAEHKPAPEPAEKAKQSEPVHVEAGPKQRRDLFDRQMQKVRAQLPSGSRAFSKVVHNRVVEDVSEFLEDTVLRPPLLITGSVIGLIFSIIVYIFAWVQGFRLSGSEVVFGFAVGWIIGAVGETIVRTMKRRKS